MPVFLLELSGFFGGIYYSPIHNPGFLETLPNQIWMWINILFILFLFIILYKLLKTLFSKSSSTKKPPN